MPAPPTSDTQVTRDAEARLNEERVVAESSLVGERLVAWVRILTFLALGMSRGISNTVLGAQGVTVASGKDPIRLVTVALYAAFAIFAVLYLRRKKPDVRDASRGTLLFVLVDFAFFFTMQLRQNFEAGMQLHNAAIAYAILLSWNVARFSWVHLALSCVLSCAGLFVGIAIDEKTAWPDGLFIVAGLFSVSLLIGATNRRIRRMFVDLRRRDALTRFLPRQVAERVMASGGALVPQQREVTILFSDLRGFTRMSEGMAPAEVLAFLDDYFARMTRLVKGRDGVVNKFIGDGLLAVWGVPEPLPRHAELAVRCALDMQKEVDELNAVRAKAGKPKIAVGVGIHTGIVAAGMLGGAEQAEYTVIGDAVNLASRIEGLTKEHGARVLLSSETRAQLGEAFSLEPLGEVPVKGRGEPVGLYKLV